MSPRRVSSAKAASYGQKVSGMLSGMKAKRSPSGVSMAAPKTSDSGPMRRTVGSGSPSKGTETSSSDGVSIPNTQFDYKRYAKGTTKSAPKKSTPKRK